jgi:general stress protein YciG
MVSEDDNGNGCAFLGEHTSSSELLNRSRQLPNIMGARDMVQNPCSTRVRPDFCESMSKESVFMQSNEKKRQGATLSSRSQWETHQRKVERMNERRQLHDANILKEIGKGGGQQAGGSTTTTSENYNCSDRMLTTAVIPTW